MKWLIAYLVSVASSVVSTILLWMVFKNLSLNIAIISLSVGIIMGYFSLKSCSNLSSSLKKEDLNFWTIFTIVSYLLFSFRAFLWLIFHNGDSVRVISPNNLGDLSLHISFIKYFVNSPEFWPDNHIFSGQKTHYPIGMDLFNSLLVLLGADLFKSLIWIGLLGSITTLFALLIWGRAFTLAGFLFNGGFAGFVFLSSFIFQDYQSELAWKNIFLSMFVTQRGLLYALPVGLLLLSSWRERFFSSSNSHSKVTLPFWIEILFYSSMPIFHIHTFIILSLLLGVWIVFLSGELRIKLLKLIGFSLPLTVFLLSLILVNSNATSSIYIKWGWMQGSDNFLKFWIYNFGIFWLLVVLLCIDLFNISLPSKFFVSSYKKRDIKESKFFILPAIVLFIVFCNVMLAKWEWDNCKLLIWPYLILLPYIWDNFVLRLNKELKYIICFFLFFSGFVCVCGGFKEHQGYEIYKFYEVAQVNKAIRQIPIDKTFAVSPAFNHPVLLCGRKIVLGYPGWIWSHGYNLEERDLKLKKLMLGQEGWEKIAKELGINYIFWGHREQNEYKNSLRPWEMSAQIIASGDWGTVYRLN